LFEGLDKLQTPAGKKPFSSEVYLQNSTGPLAPAFRTLAGDSLLDRFAILPERDEEGKKRTSAERFPPALGRDWDAYFDHFVEHYHLEGEKLAEAQRRLEQRKAAFVNWVLSGEKDVARPNPTGGAPITINATTNQRIEEYEQAQERFWEIQDGLPLFKERP